MNLNKAIYDLMENNSSIQFNELLFDYETYEEPPLIHRYIEIEPFKKYLKKKILIHFYLIWQLLISIILSYMLKNF